MNLGYHVLCEKLMGCSEEECEAMIAAQKKSGAKLMIAYRLHCDPGNLDVLERVRKGDFGDPRIFISMHTQLLRPDNHRAKHGIFEKNNNMSKYRSSKFILYSRI